MRLHLLHTSDVFRSLRPYLFSSVPHLIKKKRRHGALYLCEWTVQDSNLRPPLCKSGALPTELTALLGLNKCTAFGHFGQDPPDGTKSQEMTRRLPLVTLA